MNQEIQITPEIAQRINHVANSVKSTIDELGGSGIDPVEIMTGLMTAVVGYVTAIGVVAGIKKGDILPAIASHVHTLEKYADRCYDELFAEYQKLKEEPANEQQ